MVVHELRYALGYGSLAERALIAQGHSYLFWLEALVAVLMAGAAAQFGVSLVRARRGLAEQAGPGFVRIWLGTSVSLSLVYTLQEGFEGALAPGHPAGLIGIFGHGGWTALLLSVLIGAVIAALLRGAYQVIRYVACRRGTRPRPASGGQSWHAHPRLFGLRLDVLAWNLAGRAPPARA
jgi:hypothetical protein